MPATIHSVLHIAHLQDAIAQGLDVSDLLRCRSVSRGWRAIFTPSYRRGKVLWLKDGKDYKGQESQDMLGKYGGHVRRLFIQKTRLLPTIASHCKNISSLEVSERLCDDSRRGEALHWRRCAEFIESNCPRLQKLNLHNWIGKNLHELVSRLTQLSSLKESLQSLTFSSYQGLTPGTSDLLDLLVGLPQLTTLECGWHNSWRINHDEALLRRSTFRLRSMQIYEWSYSPMQDPAVLIPFWRQSPFLESLHVCWTPQNDSFDSFASLFDDWDDKGQPVRHTRHISFPKSFPLDDSKLDRILRGCANQYLTTLSIVRSPIGPGAFEALLETQSQSLEILDLSGQVAPGLCASPWIQKLLATCRRLKVLRVLCTEVDITSGIHLHADDILTSPWVCSGLTTLFIPILVAPKAGHLTQESDSDRSTVINRVMQQISQMDMLEELGTSKKGYVRTGAGRVAAGEEFIVPDLLSFSVGGEGGGGDLRYLARLRKMRELSVSRCALDVSVIEAWWMKRHWPGLQVISGRRRHGGRAEIVE